MRRWWNYLTKCIRLGHDPEKIMLKGAIRFGGELFQAGYYRCSRCHQLLERVDTPAENVMLDVEAP